MGTYTYATLEVPAAAFDAVFKAFKEARGDESFMWEGAMDMRGVALTRADPTVKPEQEPAFGWICYNSGPSAVFWHETWQECQHELMDSDSLRPATNLEKYLMNKQGNNTLELE